jgi:hypothetical protein
VSLNLSHHESSIRVSPSLPLCYQSTFKVSNSPTHNTNITALTRHVDGIGKTGFYRPTALLVKPYTNLAVTVHNHRFFKKTGIFEYFKAFFLVFCGFIS